MCIVSYTFKISYNNNSNIVIFYIIIIGDTNIILKGSLRPLLFAERCATLTAPSSLSWQNIPYFSASRTESSSIRGISAVFVATILCILVFLDKGR